MLRRDGGPGAQHDGPLDRRFGRDRLEASGDLAHAAAALVERAARSIRALELVPLGSERAPDLADERGRLGAGAREGGLGAALRGGLGLAGLRELSGSFGTEALDLAGPLRLGPSIGVER